MRTISSILLLSIYLLSLIALSGGSQVAASAQKIALSLSHSHDHDHKVSSHHETENSETDSNGLPPAQEHSHSHEITVSSNLGVLFLPKLVNLLSSLPLEERNYRPTSVAPKVTALASIFRPPIA